MKKYMFIAVAALFFAGVSNAQNPTHPGKKAVPKQATTAKAAQSSSTASVSPQTGKMKNTTMGIKRKHHAKHKVAKASPAK